MRARVAAAVVLGLVAVGASASCAMAETPPNVGAPAATPVAPAMPTPLPATAPATSSAALPSVDVEVCLTRSAIVPVAVSNIAEDGPPWALHDYALRTLQYELLAEHADAMAGVAPTQGEAGVMTGLRVSLPLGSQLDVVEAVRASVASMPVEYADAASTASIEVSESDTPVTFADLCRGMQRIMDETTSGGDLTFVGIDTTTGRLSVGSLGAPEPVVEEVRASLHGALDVVPDTRQVPAVSDSEG